MEVVFQKLLMVYHVQLAITPIVQLAIRVATVKTIHMAIVIQVLICVCAPVVRFMTLEQVYALRIQALIKLVYPIRNVIPRKDWHARRMENEYVNKVDFTIQQLMICVFHVRGQSSIMIIFKHALKIFHQYMQQHLLAMFNRTVQHLTLIF